MFHLIFSDEAKKQFETLSKTKNKQPIFKAVRKTLGMMETNLRHPSLNTHEFTSKKGAQGEKIFESYAQNRTPGAYRIFWCYGPDKKQITILSIPCRCSPGSSPPR